MSYSPQVGIKRELIANFRIIKAMGVDSDKREVDNLDVWKCRVHFQILAIYSPFCNHPAFSNVNHLKHSIFIWDINAHSLAWEYSVANEVGWRIQNFLS
ncbi:hypothetical protein TNCV_4592051 [Trichonephila clavipes]|nr:hypothetical protein TNCV_4592051 [Trichonephila clavipes]